MSASHSESKKDQAATTTTLVANNDAKNAPAKSRIEIAQAFARMLDKPYEANETHRPQEYLGVIHSGLVWLGWSTIKRDKLSALANAKDESTFLTELEKLSKDATISDGNFKKFISVLTEAIKTSDVKTVSNTIKNIVYPNPEKDILVLLNQIYTNLLVELNTLDVRNELQAQLKAAIDDTKTQLATQESRLKSEHQADLKRQLDEQATNLNSKNKSEIIRAQDSLKTEHSNAINALNFAKAAEIQKHIDDAKKQLDTVKAELTATQQKLLQVESAKKSELAKLASDAKDKENQLVTKISRLNDDLDSLFKKAEESQRQSTSKINHFAKQLEQKAEEFAALQREYRNAATSLTMVSNENRSMQAENTRVKSMLGAAQTQILHLKNVRNENDNAEIEELRNLLRDRDRLINAQTKTIQTSNQEKALNSFALSKLDQDRKADIKLNAEKDRLLEARTLEIKSLNSQLNDAKQKHSTSTAQLTSALTTANAELQNAKSSLGTLNVELSSSKTALASATAELKAVKESSTREQKALAETNVELRKLLEEAKKRADDAEAKAKALIAKSIELSKSNSDAKASGVSVVPFSIVGGPKPTTGAALRSDTGPATSDEDRIESTTHPRTSTRRVVKRSS